MLERDLADHAPRHRSPVGSNQCDAAVDPMPPTRQQREKCARRGLVRRLAEDAAAAQPRSCLPQAQKRRDAAAAPPRPWRTGQPQAHTPPATSLFQRRLVDLGRVDNIRRDADLAQQFEAPRRGGCEDEGSHQTGRGSLSKSVETYTVTREWGQPMTISGACRLAAFQRDPRRGGCEDEGSHLKKLEHDPFTLKHLKFSSPPGLTRGGNERTSAYSRGWPGQARPRLTGGRFPFCSKAGSVTRL